MSQLLVLEAILLPATVLTALLRFYETTSRLGMSRVVLVTAALGYICLSAAVWGTATFALHAPLDWLLTVEMWARLLLASGACAVGVLGFSNVAVGFALVYGVWPYRDAGLLAWWLAPYLIGFGVGYFRRAAIAVQRPKAARTRREFDASMEWWLKQKIAYGEVVQRAEFDDHLFRFLYLVSGGLPLGIAALLALRDVDSSLLGLHFGGGLLIAANVWLHSYALRTVLRGMRRWQQGLDILHCWLTVLTAASPLGTWLVAAWLRFPPANAYEGVPLICLLMLLWAAARTKLAARLAVRPGGQAARRLLDGFHYLFLKRGLLLFFVAAVFHPAAPLATAVLTVIAAEFLFTCWDVLWRRVPLVRRQEAYYLMLLPENERRRALGAWLYDSFWTCSRKPDVSLVVYLLEQAQLAAHSQMHFVPSAIPLSGSQRDVVRESSRWIALAEEILRLAEYELVPRWPAEHLETLRQALGTMRMYIGITRFRIAEYDNLYEEEFTALLETATAAEALGEHDLAMLSRTLAAGVLMTQLGRFDEALQQLEAILSESGQNPFVLRHALNFSIAAAMYRGDSVAAQAFRERRDRVRTTSGDVKRLMRGVSSWLRGAGVQELTNEIATMMEHGERLFDSIRTGTELEPLPLDLDVRSRALLERGMLSLAAGRAKEAQSVLEEAAMLAERDGYTNWVFAAWSHHSLARLAQGDPAGAYESISRALDTQAKLRTLVLEPDMRIGARSLDVGVFALAIRLLLSADRHPRGPWPDRPLAKAFERVEEARSRVLLELLGESPLLRSPVDAGLLIEEEQAMIEKYLQVREAFDTVTPQARQSALVRLREAYTALDKVRSRIAQVSPAAAEYVALRRGNPTSYDEVRKLLTM